MDESNKTTFIAGLLTIPGVIGLMVYSYWAGAYVLVYLWGWFVVPLTNWQAIVQEQALGILLITSYLTHTRSSSKDDESAWIKFSIIALRPWVALLIGYIIKSIYA